MIFHHFLSGLSWNHNLYLKACNPPGPAPPGPATKARPITVAPPWQSQRQQCRLGRTYTPPPPSLHSPPRGGLCRPRKGGPPPRAAIIGPARPAARAGGRGRPPPRLGSGARAARASLPLRGDGTSRADRARPRVTDERALVNQKTFYLADSLATGVRDLGRPGAPAPAVTAHREGRGPNPSCPAGAAPRPGHALTDSDNSAPPSGSSRLPVRLALGDQAARSAPPPPAPRARCVQAGLPASPREGVAEGDVGPVALLAPAPADRRRDHPPRDHPSRGRRGFPSSADVT